MYDLIIKNGTLIDGTGMPPYYADIAIQNGKIARIGKGLVGGAQTEIHTRCRTEAEKRDTYSRGICEIL